MAVVSVIVPMYKVEKYIERCLESLIDQIFMDIEIICIDDGSPDKSSEIAERYAAKDQRIKVVHKKNAGLGMARNTGIEHASGKYVMFVDSDDYLEPTLTESLVKCAETNGADTVIAAYSRNNGKQIEVIPNPIVGCKYCEEEIIPNVLNKMVGPLGDGSDTINMAAWRVLYSLDLIREHDLKYPSEREFISEDIIFDIKYYVHSKCVCGIDDAGYIYCMNPESLTEKYNPERYEKGKTLFYEKRRLMKEFGIYNVDAEYRAEQSFLRYSRYAIKSECKFALMNGKKKAKENLSYICQSAELKKVIKKYKNEHKALLDKIIDECVLKDQFSVLYNVLRIGYLARGNR